MNFKAGQLWIYEGETFRAGDERAPGCEFVAEQAEWVFNHQMYRDLFWLWQMGEPMTRQNMKDIEYFLQIMMVQQTADQDGENANWERFIALSEQLQQVTIWFAQHKPETAGAERENFHVGASDEASTVD